MIQNYYSFPQPIQVEIINNENEQAKWFREYVLGYFIRYDEYEPDYLIVDFVGMTGITWSQEKYSVTMLEQP